MAITRTNMTSASEMVAILEGLGWFGSVEYDSGQGDIYCYIDNGGTNHKLISIPWTAGSYTVNFNFYPIAGSTEIKITESCMPPRVCWQTRNGILITTATTGRGQNDLFAIIGKTNNNKIAVAVGHGYQDGSGTGKLGTIKTCAEGENDGLINSILHFRDGVWNGYTQIAQLPIPTHPSTGTSYIKGASCFAVAPTIEPGIFTIDGVEYATNGSIALSDGE